MELKPVRDFKFTPTWSHTKDAQEFDVTYLGTPIGTVWQSRKGWAWKRINRTSYSKQRYKNRIAAARALSDEPIADPATRYPSKKRSRRKKLTASELLNLSSGEFWETLVESLRDDYAQTLME